MYEFELLKFLHFTNMTWVYVMPLCFMGIDILTGLLNAMLKEKNFKSSIMRTGLTKKAGEIAIILVAIVCTYALDIPIYLVQGISLYISLMEFMSIFENADKMGVPLPKFVKDLVNNVGDSIQHDDLKTMTEKVHKLEAVLEANHITFTDIDDLK